MFQNPPPRFTQRRVVGNQPEQTEPHPTDERHGALPADAHPDDPHRGALSGGTRTDGSGSYGDFVPDRPHEPGLEPYDPARSASGGSVPPEATGPGGSERRARQPGTS